MQKYSTFPNIETFDFWIANNLNVLFFGKHGVGKTSMIIDAFTRNKIKYQMFSASTMDPWVDFIGVPKEQHDEKGAYLELIQPKSFRDNEVEALFFDELNRSHKKVRNAIMELIQFRSINGRKFPNLRFVWGAVNPSDDENVKYDVEELDAAQADRFQVHVEIPYKPYAPYLRQKYGRDFADGAIEWWDKLPQKLQNQVSPRRLEYALQMYKNGGNLAYILPQNSNIDKLLHTLKNGSPHKKFAELLACNDETQIKNFLADENNYEAVTTEIINEPAKCMHLISEEKLCALIHKNISVAYYIVSDYQKFQSVIENLATNSIDKQIRMLMVKCRAQYKQEDIFNCEILKPTAVARSSRYKLERIKKSYEWNSSQELVIPSITGRLSTYNTINECVSHAINKIDKTVERRRILQSLASIAKVLGTSMTQTDATMALKLIEVIVSKTQTDTLLSHNDYIFALINICVRVIRNTHAGTTIEDLVSQYPNIAAKIWYQSPYHTMSTLRNCVRPQL